MALADYYKRAAVAAVQVLDGFDEGWFEAQLESVHVGITFDDQAATPEGQALLDLCVRLLSRLYPRLAIVGPTAEAAKLRRLATAINPAIDLTKNAEDVEVGIGVGVVAQPFPTTIYAGSTRWDALIDDEAAQPLGDSDNPFGPGAAACLAAANLFRYVFLGVQSQLDRGLRFSTLLGDRVDEPTRNPRRKWRLDGRAALIGCGAIGNAVTWALARAPLDGEVHLVDHEAIELSNLQRYVLAARCDEEAVKTELARTFGRAGGPQLISHPLHLADFLETEGYEWDYFLLALDSAADRRSAQAALPRWVANAWTQPRDLGCSIHPRFGGDGACVACTYLPEGAAPHEDELVARALRVPQLQQQIRTLLHTGAPVQRDILSAVAAAIGRPVEILLPYEGRPIRDLYVEGFCGGAVIPVQELGRPRGEMHVPLAHQSALAGVLLAAALVRSAIGADPEVTTKTQLDLLGPVGQMLAQPLLARRDGRCICDDRDFVAAYKLKYSDLDLRSILDLEHL